MTLDYQFYSNEASVMGILCSFFFPQREQNMVGFFDDLCWAPP